MKSILPLIFALSYLQIAFSQLVLERDINQEAASSNPEYIAELNNQLYFRADDGINGEELYQYDIATGATNLVANLRPFDQGGSPNGVIALDSKIYFSSRDEVQNDHFLFVHDPVDNSTQRVLDNQGDDIKEPFNLFVFNGQLFFAAEFSEGTEPGYYDPATNTIVMLGDLNPDGNSSPNFFNEVDGELWFVANGGGQSDSRLWKYNPDTEVTENIIYNSPNNLFPSMSFLYHFNGELLFRGFTQSTGEELWRYDIASNTLLETDEVSPGPSSSSPAEFRALEGKVYFAARTNADGRELRVYDPNTETVTLVADILMGGNGNPGKILELDNRLYFTATVDTNLERKLFSYNENEGLIEVGALDNNGAPNYLSLLFEKDGTLYLSGTKAETGVELYKFTSGGEVELAADINQTTIGSDPFAFAAFNGKLYFAADEIVSGREIWVYDPTTGNVDILSDLPGNTSPNFLTPLDNKLFFTGIHPVEGYGILYYDPVTEMIDVTSYTTPGNTGHISSVAVYNDLLYFSATDEDFGRELFVYRPLDDSYERLTDLNQDGGSLIEKLFVYENELYFQADNGQTGRELWKYNDQTGVTSLVVDINPGSEGSSLDWFEIYDNEIYFSAFGENTSQQLFSFNTTTQELTQRTDISGNLDPRYLRVYNDRLYFSGRFSSSIGRELMYYDALNDTTILIQDLDIGSGSSSPENLTVFNNKLYFSASTDEFGNELYEYNDTAVSIVADIRSGVPDADPRNLYLFNDKIYFSANDGIRGAELWSIAECLNLFVDTEPQIGMDGAGAIDLSIEGGTPPYQIAWSNGEITEDIDDLQQGMYTATVTDATGCISEITAEVTFLSSIENRLDLSQFKIYPNPNRGNFFIEIEELKIESVEVLDLAGRLIYQKSNTNDFKKIELQLNYASSGVYLIRIRNRDGVGYKKILID